MGRVGVDTCRGGEREYDQGCDADGDVHVGLFA